MSEQAPSLNPPDVIACGGPTDIELCEACIDAYRNGIEPGESACEARARGEFSGHEPAQSKPSECECSDEYGPCEQHGDTLVVREGASLHTADELALLLVSDLNDCGVVIGPNAVVELVRLQEILARDTDPVSGCGWFADPDDAEAAQDLAQRTESNIGNLWVVQNDGYVIVRPHDDCPLLDGNAPIIGTVRVLGARYTVEDDGDGGSMQVFSETDADDLPVAQRDETAECETVEQAAAIIRDSGATQNVGSWYADPDGSFTVDYGTGEQEETSAHLDGFTDVQLAAIDELVSGKGSRD